jgi:hypothetical protein
MLVQHINFTNCICFFAPWIGIHMPCFDVGLLILINLLQCFPFVVDSRNQSLLSSSEKKLWVSHRPKTTGAASWTRYSNSRSERQIALDSVARVTCLKLCSSSRNVSYCCTSFFSWKPGGGRATLPWLRVSTASKRACLQFRVIALQFFPRRRCLSFHRFCKRKGWAHYKGFRSLILAPSILTLSLRFPKTCIPFSKINLHYISLNKLHGA